MEGFSGVIAENTSLWRIVVYDMGSYIDTITWSVVVDAVTDLLDGGDKHIGGSGLFWISLRGERDQ